MVNRRDFVLTTAAAGGAWVLPGTGLAAAGASSRTTSKSLRILILGATGFIGPHFIESAVSAGHRVSVFLHNKSPVPSDLSPRVESLLGDRNGDLNAIRNRDWDAVLDLATYVPNWVRTLGQTLKGRVGHYTFISTISVYQFPGASDENSKVTAYTDATDPYSLTFQGKQYGPLKTLCEQEAQRQFPGKTLILRPGHMVGPREKAGAFTYLPARMEKGGEILTAGTPLDPVQMIDVRDLAAWVVRMVEQGETGVFNTTGPALTMGWGEMLGGVRGVFSVPMTLTWVPISWLTERKVSFFSPLLFWPSEIGTPGVNRINVDKACAKGLTFRALSATAIDTLAWYKAQSPDRQRGALIGFSGPASLEDTMKREKSLIEEWRTERR